MKSKRGTVLVVLLSAVAVFSLVVIGYFYLQNHTQRSIKIKTGNQTPTPVTKAESVNWKSYTDQKSSFSFKYPPNAALMDGKIGATVVLPGDKPVAEEINSSFINLTFESIDLKGKSLVDYVKDQKSRLLQYKKRIDKDITSISINGLDGYSYTSTDTVAFGFTTKHIYLESSDKKSNIYIGDTHVDVNNLGYQNIIDQILGTFKFLNNQNDETVKITEKDNGKTVSVKLYSRFWVELDDKLHPLNKLESLSCKVIGYVSNWSINGPDNYPIGFEATNPGRCVLRNGDFAVTINVLK